MEEALKEGKDAVVADLDAAEVLQPSVGAFDFPAAFVASEFACIFIASLSLVAAVGTIRSVPRCFSRSRNGSES